MKVLEIKICSDQIVGKVWTSRRKTPDPLSGHLRFFFMDGENAKIAYLFAIFLGGPMAAIQSWWAYP